MSKHILTIAAAVPIVQVADCTTNVQRMTALATQAAAQGADITIFPRLCLTGATCGDLASKDILLKAAQNALNAFAAATAQLPGTFVVSLPIRSDSGVITETVAVSKGQIIACATGEATLPLHDDIELRPACTPVVAGQWKRQRQALIDESARSHKAIVYCNCGFGETTTDAVYGGETLIVSDGVVLAEGERLVQKEQLVSATIDTDALCAAQALSSTPFLPSEEERDEWFEEVLCMQTIALATRMTHIRCSKVIIGISGGLDSTLALLVAVRTFDRMGLDRKGILGITMPGFGTSGRTYHNALALMKALGITMQEISIREACLQHFTDIGISADNHDVTYENAQARERTQILMDLANKENAIVIGTGDLSELALGWCTYNGDHMSMYGVNASIPKTVMQHLVRHIAHTTDEKAVSATLLDIVDTPISPELVPADAPVNNTDNSAVSSAHIAQKTEVLVGPYELHDFFLYHFISRGCGPRRLYIMARKVFAGKYTDDELRHWLRTFFRRFFNQQFKRSCMPDGAQVTEVSLSPRGAWRMPSDVSATTWLKECDELDNQ